MPAVKAVHIYDNVNQLADLLEHLGNGSALSSQTRDECLRAAKFAKTLHTTPQAAPAAAKTTGCAFQQQQILKSHVRSYHTHSVSNMGGLQQWLHTNAQYRPRVEYHQKAASGTIEFVYSIEHP